jgi:hypothetical protein
MATQDILDQIDRLRDDDPSGYSWLIQALQRRVERDRAEEMEAQDALDSFASGLAQIDHEGEADDFVARCEELVRDWPHDLHDDAVTAFRAGDLEQTLRTLAGRSRELADKLMRSEYDEQLIND